MTVAACIHVQYRSARINIIYCHHCSGKFWRKVHFIATLQDLSSYVSVEDSLIAAPVLAVDQVIMSRRPARRKYQQDIPAKPDQQDKDSAATATKES